MNWNYYIKETSSGAYDLEATRSTGHKIMLQTAASERHKIYEESFRLECELGTSESKALFLVVSGVCPSWRSEYHEETFGSWLVAGPNGLERYVFDGKNSMLFYYKDSGIEEFNCRVLVGGAIDSKVFCTLALTSHS